MNNEQEDMGDGDLENRPNILVRGFTSDEMKAFVHVADKS